jgi:Flp pilus assembly protein TadG
MFPTQKQLRGSARSGQAIVLIAFAMVGLLAFMVLAIDGGRFYQQRRRAQNAADMSALAALYNYTKATDPSTVSEHSLLVTINQLAEKNEIADTDSDPDNAVNGNITAWWVNKNGEKLPIGAPEAMQDSTSRFAPSGVNAIQVQTRIPYGTFIGGLIGQPYLTAQADGIARLSIRYKTFTDDNTSIFTVGGDCNNLTDKIAHNYVDTNTSKFEAGVYVGGSLTVGLPPGGGVNASDFYGDFTVAVITGQGTGGTYTDIGTTDPFAGGGNNFHGHTYHPPTSTPKGYPEWSQVYGHTLDAADFYDGVHNTPEGSWHKNMSWLGAGDPDLVYQYVAGDPGAEATINTIYSDPANSGKHLVIFVDGDLTTSDNTNWEHTTLIIKGKFDNTRTGRDFYTAGGVVGNISVLAGANLGGSAQCASDPANWVFHAQGNNTQFHGIVYVPHGQIYFDGNTSGGRDFSDAVITYSVYLNGNSWQFNFDPSKLVWPIPSTELNK